MNNQDILDYSPLEKEKLLLNWTQLLQLFCIIIPITGFIGASINVINSYIGTFYYALKYQTSMIPGEAYFSKIWPQALSEGLNQGLQLGLIFCLMYLFIYTYITKTKGNFTFAIQQVKQTIPIVYYCWFCGLLLGAFAGIFNPFYGQNLVLDSSRYPYVSSFSDGFTYVMVDMGLWGAHIGIAIALIFSYFNVKGNWVHNQRKEQFKKV